MEVRDLAPFLCAWTLNPCSICSCVCALGAQMLCHVLWAQYVVVCTADHGAHVFAHIFLCAHQVARRLRTTTFCL